MKSFDKDELKELLNKSWMTHDGMWFYHCLQECGIEKTNKINRAAIRSMSAIEVMRYKKAFGVSDIETFEQLKEFTDGIYSIVKADFMKFSHHYTSENSLHMEMTQCFAYDGIKSMGVIDRYECGIFERVKGWFEGLGIPYRVTPEVEGCMMYTDGKCFRDFSFNM